ncbi:MAG: histidine--tRNA ligase [Candidatus Lloydbacteria bacterium RIFCSPHIGHO2_01_FULL_41_20]|uniref:Histidine--tRNA ligase n=1 Tax=Candidatus Lloydbacteria bacterium RIFCSPHIGHO2_01_FULL_41_20 TaxID=1798657 RepID=A0A1G2CTQ8_9BACT|nr:MAG: histidine--tRNA ligase [Candidatus Lloydbacteria bacterium RIFCSPHIGHO2_01_FULL_41_20]
MTNKEPLQAPKGMRDIQNEEYYKYQGLFEKAQEVAIYYGFKPIELPILEKEDVFTSGIGIGTDIVDKEMYVLKTKGGDHLAMRPEGTAGVMRAYIEHGMQSLPQPVMLYYYGPFFRHDKPQRGRYRQFYQFGLEMLGAPQSVADAIIIRTVATILEESGFKDISVTINSIGDKECRPRYIKELQAYYRKHDKELCEHCKERIRENPLRILDCKEEKCAALKAGAPDSLAYLCSDCKDHFKEVLEYLEEMKIPYNLDKTLVRGLNYYTRTVFEFLQNFSEIEGEENKLPLSVASGGRYDYLGKALGSKKDVPAVGVSIGVDRVILSSKHKPLAPRIIKKPKICFIQLGFEAKLKSLAIIEILRKARIPITQSLSKDGLSAQLGNAEALQVPYSIIFGQKEAMEQTVIVRNMQSRSQDTVEIDKLAEYLKELK